MSKQHSHKLWLWGHHAVETALVNPNRQHYQCYVTGDERAMFQKYPALKGVPLRIVDQKEMQAQLGVDAVHQGIALQTSPLPELSIEKVDTTRPQQIIVVLDQVTDPHNLGAIIRSAKAMGASALVTPFTNSAPLNGVAAKAACGALDLLPIVQVVNLTRALTQLQEQGFWVVGLAEEGTDRLDQCDLTGKIVLVLGAEGSGLRRLTRDTCDFLAHLPTDPTFPSLNVSVAASISLYEASRQQRLKK